MGEVIEKGWEGGLGYGRVLLVERGEGRVRDGGGYLGFKKLWGGEYRLKVEIMGYRSEVKKVRVSKEFVVEMDFVMEEESMMRDEVVVWGKGNERRGKVGGVVVNVMRKKLFEIVNWRDLGKWVKYEWGLGVEKNWEKWGLGEVGMNGLEGGY